MCLEPERLSAPRHREREKRFGSVPLGGGSDSITGAFVALVLAFMLISILYHMRIGIQVIIEDYVHEEGPKIVLLALNIFFPIVLGVLSLAALFKIVLGG